jgi:hypothetical protein
MLIIKTSDAYYTHEQHIAHITSNWINVNNKIFSAILSDYSGLLDKNSNRGGFYDDISRVFSRARDDQIDLAINIDESGYVPFFIIDKIVTIKKLCRVNNIVIYMRSNIDEFMLCQTMTEIDNFVASDNIATSSIYTYDNSWITRSLTTIDHRHILNKLVTLSIMPEKKISVCIGNFLVEATPKLRNFFFDSIRIIDNRGIGSKYQQVNNDTFFRNLINVNISSVHVEYKFFSQIMNSNSSTIKLHYCKIKDLNDGLLNEKSVFKFKNLTIYRCYISNSLKTLSRVTGEAINFSFNFYDNEVFDSSIFNNGISNLTIDYLFDTNNIIVELTPIKKLCVLIFEYSDGANNINFFSRLLSNSKNITLRISNNYFKSESYESLNNLLSNGFEHLINSYDHCYDKFSIIPSYYSNYKIDHDIAKKILSTLSTVCIKKIYIDNITFDSNLLHHFFDLYSSNDYLIMMRIQGFNAISMWDCESTKQAIDLFFETNKIFTKLDCIKTPDTELVTIFYDQLKKKCEINTGYLYNQRFRKIKPVS